MHGQECAAFLVAVSESADKFAPLKRNFAIPQMKGDDGELRIERVIARIKHVPQRFKGHTNAKKI